MKSSHLLGLTLALGGVGAPAVAQAQSCEYPGVLLVVDRSTSMRSSVVEGGPSKWSIAQDAVASLLNAHGDAAHFGLMIYPGPDGLGENGVEGTIDACRHDQAAGVCSPAAPRCSTGQVVVPIGANTSAAILSELEPDPPSSSYTPTWQTLQAADGDPSLRVPNRRNFVVLVTDGWQCCGVYNNGNNCEWEDRTIAVDKVGELTDHGVTTFIVGFGASVDVQTLQNMAVRAGTERSPDCNPAANAPADDRCYYQASSQAQLTAMLDDIVRQISVETCDGLDNDCDGQVDEGLTQACNNACGAGERTCVNGQWGQCSAVDVRPEVCNGLDDDCDGQIDEGISERSCTTACGIGVETCDDGRWVECDAPPVQIEDCDNGVDDDCNGVVDDGVDCGECEDGAQEACGSSVGVCEPGVRTCINGEWGFCDAAVLPTPETCNGRDDDCDGLTDGLIRDCQTACGSGTETCENGQWVRCDAQPAIEELCNGVDDDCDGQIDEALTRTCSTACGEGRETCVNGAWAGCDARTPAPEVCGNRADDNCDGRVDESCPCTDGETQPCGEDEGVCQPGTQACVGGQWGDCVGGVGGTPEICNGVDDDCDGTIDVGDVCTEGELCACGGCAKPCEHGECPGAIQCVRGYCIEDRCPEGFLCTDGSCIPGERTDGGTGPGFDIPDAGSDGSVSGDGASASDCSCRVGGDGRPAVAGLMFLAALALVRRRRR